MKCLRFMGLGLGDRQFDDDRSLAAAHRDVARAERLQRRVERRRRQTLGRVPEPAAGRSAIRRVVGDLAGHLVVFLVDVAEEHG